MAARPKSDLLELFRFWGGSRAGPVPESTEQLCRNVNEWMCDPARADARIKDLGRRLNQILSLLLDAPGFLVSHYELVNHKGIAFLSAYELEASLSTLLRRGILVDARDRRFKNYGGKAYAMPVELAEGILSRRKSRARGVFHTLTLRGHLERLADDSVRLGNTPPSRLREMYKMYSNEAAAVARIRRLPDDLRGLVEKATLHFGGLLPRSFFERMETDLPGWDARRWSPILEESLIGTIDRLELAGYGIQHNDETLIVFNEVALAWLRHVAVPGDPDQPHKEASLGVDLVSNISRFMGFILEHNVRFTVRGEIFKTTEKRILSELIPNPGRELERSEVLSFITQFARKSQLIESTGERTFAVTARAREWEPLDLERKLQRLLDFAVEEKGRGGDRYHQVRLRRGFLRLLKRVETMVWYDLMYLPFLARNNYLASLDELEVDQYFAQFAQAGQYTPMEDPQRLVWNLAKWVRQRIHLLGLVDLGYDSSDRPVAMRLTRIGAKLLGVGAPELETCSPLGSLVVTPDFEVVMFTNGDDAQLVHELDRFCLRNGGGQPMHFRITDRSIHRSLSEGMLLSRILETLKTHSRTPVPENVTVSIRGWALRAGLMLLDKTGVLECEEPDTMNRFKSDAAARNHVRGELDDRRVQMKTRYSMRRLQSLLRSLDYLVELKD